MRNARISHRGSEPSSTTADHRGDLSLQADSAIQTVQCFRKLLDGTHWHAHRRRESLPRVSCVPPIVQSTCSVDQTERDNHAFGPAIQASLDNDAGRYTNEHGDSATNDPWKFHFRAAFRRTRRDVVPPWTICCILHLIHPVMLRRTIVRYGEFYRWPDIASQCLKSTLFVKIRTIHAPSHASHPLVKSADNRCLKVTLSLAIGTNTGSPPFTYPYRYGGETLTVLMLTFICHQSVYPSRLLTDQHLCLTYTTQGYPGRLNGQF